jgi:hypothetical protein
VVHTRDKWETIWDRTRPIVVSTEELCAVGWSSKGSMEHVELRQEIVIYGKRGKGNMRTEGLQAHAQCFSERIKPFIIHSSNG